MRCYASLLLCGGMGLRTKAGSNASQAASAPQQLPGDGPQQLFLQLCSGEACRASQLTGALSSSTAARVRGPLYWPAAAAMMRTHSSSLCCRVSASVFRPLPRFCLCCLHSREAVSAVRVLDEQKVASQAGKLVSPARQGCNIVGGSHGLVWQLCLTPAQPCMLIICGTEAPWPGGSFPPAAVCMGVFIAF